jgi:pumilio family protein 6
MKTLNKEKQEGNKSNGKGYGSGNRNRNENENGNKNSKGKFNSKPGGKFGNNRNKNGGDGIKFIANKKTIVVDENRKNLRRLYNRLMMKDSKNKNPANKPEIVKKVLQQIDNNYSEFCFKPDGCRVLQGCIKYGSKNQKNELIKSLKPQFYELIIKKYAIYLAIKIFKYSDNKQKEDLLKSSVLPNLGKLLKNAQGQLFLNFVFDNVLSKHQNMICDQYSRKIFKSNIAELTKEKNNQVKNENENENENENDTTNPANDIILHEREGSYKKDNMIEALKSHIEKQLEKGIHKVFCFQAFLNRIFEDLDHKTQSYISEVFDDDVNELLTNKSGVELASKLFTVASVKTRKKMVKKIKESVKSYLSNDSIVLFLIKVILFNDDTKLVEKHILNTLLEALTEEFLTNKSILKIFCNLLNYRNNKINTQQENKIISYDLNCSSKKDDYKRQEEIMSVILEELFRIVDINIKFCISDDSYVIILNDLIEYLIKTKNEEKLIRILNDVYAVMEIDYKRNFDELSNSIFAAKTGHFAVIKILKAFDSAVEEEVNANANSNLLKIKMEFCEKVTKILLKNVEGFLNTKAIFIFVKLVENPKTKSLVEKELTKHKALIKENENKEKLSGFQILSKALFA